MWVCMHACSDPLIELTIWTVSQVPCVVINQCASHFGMGPLDFHTQVKLHSRLRFSFDFTNKGCKELWIHALEISIIPLVPNIALTLPVKYSNWVSFLLLRLAILHSSNNWISTLAPVSESCKLLSSENFLMLLACLEFLATFFSRCLCASLPCDEPP